MKGLKENLDFKKKASIIFFIVGSIIGSVSGFVSAAGIGLIEIFLITLFLFIITSKVILKKFDWDEEPKRNENLEIIKIGLSPYWPIWLIFWIVVHNIVILP